MTREDIQKRVIESLLAVAPGITPTDPKASLREQCDLDSMDFLRFVARLHDAFGVTVPERDYSKIDSLEGCALYLETHGGH